MTRLIFALMLLASPAAACGPGTDCYQPPAPPPVVTPPTDGDSEQPGQSTGRNYDLCCVRDDGAVLFKSPLRMWGPEQCLKDVAKGVRPKCGRK